jgi:hypothetical protein
MLAQLRRSLLVAPAIGLCALVAFAAHTATAQSATGTVTGRVVWGTCVRGIPLPISPEGQPQRPQIVPPDVQVAPDSQATPGNGLPAGAVLVAVQNTSVNARTDEGGRFTLSGVPAGQYLTVAAGPVANASSAVAGRPNVFVSGGQSVDIGSLSLGGQQVLSIACRFPFGPQGAAGDTTTTPPTPGDTTTP